MTIIIYIYCRSTFRHNCFTSVIFCTMITLNYNCFIDTRTVGSRTSDPVIIICTIIDIRSRRRSVTYSVNSAANIAG